MLADDDEGKEANGESQVNQLQVMAKRPTCTLSLATQEKINQVNSRLHSLNLFMNYTNAKSTMELKQEYDKIKLQIKGGHAAVLHLQHALSVQGSALLQVEGSVDELGLDIQKQQRQYNALSTEVTEQKHELQDAITDIEGKLATQHQLIRSQEQALQRLLAVRFRMDFGVDLVILLLAWWAAHLRLSQAGLRVLLTPLLMLLRRRAGPAMLRRGVGAAGGQGAKQQRLLQQLSTLVLVGALSKQIKLAAVSHGLHNLVGSYSSYASRVAHMGAVAVGLPWTSVEAWVSWGRSMVGVTSQESPCVVLTERGRSSSTSPRSPVLPANDCSSSSNSSNNSSNS